VNVGDLVIIVAEPELGVGRVERFVDVNGARAVRVLLYRDGTFIVRAESELAPCPPNTRVA
jgi:hypothetical protein